MLRNELVRELDALLNLHSIADDSNNGLQVEGKDEIRALAFALDACQATIDQAVSIGADMLIVHHGLYRGQVVLARGTHASRLRACFAGGLSLYAAHLPLDAHPALGNNIALVEDAGFTPAGWFWEHRGTRIGALGEHAEGLSLDEICANLERSLLCHPARIIGNDGALASRKIKKAAAIGGGVLRYFDEVVKTGAELFITGEGSHSAYHNVVESGVITLLYGHYMSEMVGIRRLSAYCEKTYRLRCAIIEAPTGY